MFGNMHICLVPPSLWRALAAAEEEKALKFNTLSICREYHNHQAFLYELAAVLSKAYTK